MYNVQSRLRAVLGDFWGEIFYLSLVRFKFLGACCLGGQLLCFYLFERNSPNFFKTDAVLSAYAAGTSFSVAKKKQNAIQELRP